LLQTIKGFSQLENPVWKLRTLKPRRLLNIDIFLYKPIKESRLDIYLLQFEAFSGHKGKQNPNGFQTSYRGKGLIIIYTLLLTETLGN